MKSDNEISNGEIAEQSLTLVWPLFTHPENDRDVTERAQGYTLQDASFSVNPSVPFWACEKTLNTQVVRAMTSVFLWNMRWRQGCTLTMKW